MKPCKPLCLALGLMALWLLIAGCPGQRRDRDLDGIDDAVDLCPDVADPAQKDSDGDGLGDACDPTPWGGPIRLEYGVWVGVFKEVAAPPPEPVEPFPSNPPVEEKTIDFGQVGVGAYLVLDADFDLTGVQLTLDGTPLAVSNVLLAPTYIAIPLKPALGTGPHALEMRGPGGTFLVVRVLFAL